MVSFISVTEDIINWLCRQKVDNIREFFPPLTQAQQKRSRDAFVNRRVSVPQFSLDSVCEDMVNLKRILNCLCPGIPEVDVSYYQTCRQGTQKTKHQLLSIFMRKTAIKINTQNSVFLEIYFDNFNTILLMSRL